MGVAPEPPFAAAFAELAEVLERLPSTSFSRVLITGSREWADNLVIEAALDQCNARFTRMCVVHGTARGADRIADHYAQASGWAVDPHPAKWKVHTARCPSGPHMGKGHCTYAGHRRNAEMVDLGAAICLAFIRDRSSGATGCAKLAEDAGIPTVMFSISGESPLTESVQLSLSSA